MKILLTVHQFLPDYSSGTEILTLHTAQELIRLGHEVIVLTAHPHKEPPAEETVDRYEHDGVPVVRLHTARVPLIQEGGEREFNNRVFARFFRRLLREEKPDVVHFFHLLRLSGSAIDVCGEFNIPCFMTTTDFWMVCPMGQLLLPDKSHCDGPDPLARNCLRHIVNVSQRPDLRQRLARIPDFLLGLIIRLIRWNLFPHFPRRRHVKGLSYRAGFMRQQINKLDRVLIPTKVMERHLFANGLDPRRARFLPFGLRQETINRQFERGREERLRVGFIGMLHENKGPHILIRAVTETLADVPLDLQIYGRQSEFPVYVEQLEKLAGDDERIRFMGTFPNPEIGRVLDGMDVLVVPSVWHENTPLVVYSAQAAGCPIIASNVEGIAEVVADGKDGLLPPPGNVAALGKAIRRVAEDRDFLRRLAESAPRPMTMVEYATELQNLYREYVTE